MALHDVTGSSPLDGWIPDGNSLWTRTADQTFTVTGDQTAVFQPGTRLRWTQTTVKYGVVRLSSHAAGTTTVTIATTTDYVLTAAAISLNSYSYAASPQGYPDWFAFTPTYTGFSVNPTVFACQFRIEGKLVTWNYRANAAGTSNANTFTITFPVTPTHFTVQVCRGFNNGAFLVAPAMLEDAGGGVMNLFSGWNSGVWVTSGGKSAYFTVIYPF